MNTVAVTQCSIPRDGKAGPDGARPKAVQERERMACDEAAQDAATGARRVYDEAVAVSYRAEQRVKAARRAADRAAGAMWDARARWRAARGRARRRP